MENQLFDRFAIVYHRDSPIATGGTEGISAPSYFAWTCEVKHKLAGLEKKSCISVPFWQSSFVEWILESLCLPSVCCQFTISSYWIVTACDDEINENDWQLGSMPRYSVNMRCRGCRYPLWSLFVCRMFDMILGRIFGLDSLSGHEPGIYHSYSIIHLNT